MRETAVRGWQDRAEWSPLAGVAEDGLAYRLRLELGDQVDAEKITLAVTKGKGKKKEETIEIIPLGEIEKAIVQISFK